MALAGQEANTAHHSQGYDSGSTKSIHDQSAHLGSLPDNANPGLPLSIQLLLNALLPVCVICERLHEVASLLVQAVVQEIAVQMGPQQGRANEVAQAQLVQISGCDKPARHQPTSISIFV